MQYRRIAVPEIASLVLALLLLQLATALQAHHSFPAEFLEDQETTLTGIVSKVWWKNPHARFSIDVTDEAGKVLAINNVPYVNFAKEDIKKRFTEGRLKNVQPRVVEASHMFIEPKSVDVAFIVMAYHDTYWIDEKEGWPEIDTNGFIDSMKRMLKPGGKLLIIDHNAPAGSGREMAGKAHRLSEDYVKKAVTARGFVLEKTWDGLRNKDDQLDKMVFDPAVRGKTDRYVHLYKVK